MDIRDVQQEPANVGLNLLEEIYRLQKVILDHYIGIEGLPQYPVDVNTKSSQTLLKDFTGRVTEELAEGFESHLQALNIVKKYGFNLDIVDEKDKSLLISHLQNLNEEQADAMHFMVELLIYANIQPRDIEVWVKAKYKEYYTNHEYVCTGDILGYAMALGHIQGAEDYNFDPTLKPISDIRYDLTPILGEAEKYIPGGRSISEIFTSKTRLSLWDVTYSLNISRNCLKNKPWKQTGVMTNESLYQSKLVEAFVYMVGYFSRLGMTSQDVYYLYFKKNMINQFRIKSQY